VALWLLQFIFEVLRRVDTPIACFVSLDNLVEITKNYSNDYERNREMVVMMYVVKSSSLD